MQTDKEIIRVEIFPSELKRVEVKKSQSHELGFKSPKLLTTVLTTEPYGQNLVCHTRLLNTINPM